MNWIDGLIRTWEEKVTLTCETLTMFVSLGVVISGRERGPVALSLLLEWPASLLIWEVNCNSGLLGYFLGRRDHHFFCPHEPLASSCTGVRDILISCNVWEETACTMRKLSPLLLCVEKNFLGGPQLCFPSLSECEKAIQPSLSTSEKW